MGLQEGPHENTGPGTVCHRALGNAHVVRKVGMVLLGPSAVLLRTPKAVLAGDNTPPGYVWELRDLGGIWGRDDGVEPSEIQSDSGIERGERTRN